MEHKKIFGTDGIRGTVGTPPITADFALKLGWAIGQMAKKSTPAEPVVLIGKDTRISGYMLESALEAGLSAAGCYVLLVGPMPTPGIAYLTQTLRADLGIVISASHNPFPDNGIKLFSSQGLKIGADAEALIESFLDQPVTTLPAATLGKAARVSDASGRYIEFCKSTLPHHSRLNPLKIVLDCANGATYKTAPFVFAELGATVITIHHTPNGLNINHQCGSNHPAEIQRAVLKEKADIGIALDGDGDRIVMVDHLGEILDGDELIYIIFLGLLEANRFTGGIVGTELTNIGLERAFHQLNVPFERVSVGDQHIIKRLMQNGWILGGEPSGHITYLPVTTTADGVITALQVLLTCIKMQKNLHDIKQGLKKTPQYSGSIRFNNTINATTLPLPEWIDYFQKQLGIDGRIIIRLSGTEPVIRFMIEHDDINILQQMGKHISQYINEQIKK